MLRRFMARVSFIKRPTTRPVFSLPLYQAPPRATPLRRPVMPLPVRFQSASALGGQRFFSALGQMQNPYVLGPVVNLDYIKAHQAKIAASKKQLKTWLACHEAPQKDLNSFVDLLFNFKQAAKVIEKIDAQAKIFLAAIDPKLFEDYNKAALEKSPEKMQAFFQNHFLPALRKIFQALSRHYGFDPQLAETNDGLLMDDDYIDYVSEGKLILDLGEDGHGPLPHLIAAFMMKELEIEGLISNARALYQSLAEKCGYYCTDRANFTYRFLVLLDFPNNHLMPASLFCNPSSLTNHLLLNSETLKHFTRLCQNHARELAELSLKEWKQREDKPRLIRGKIMPS